MFKYSSERAIKNFCVNHCYEIRLLFEIFSFYISQFQFLKFQKLAFRTELI